MPDKSQLARGWILKGDSDFATARLVLQGDGPFDTACFHAQQAAEKYLKGLLAYSERPFPSTHNLEDLEHLCTQSVPGWGLPDLDLTMLTPFAVELRYDFEFWPEKQTAQESLDVSQKVRSAVVSCLPSEAQPAS